MLSSAKNMIYLFQEADGLQTISAYRVGRQDPDHVKGQFCRAEGQRKGELLFAFSQSFPSPASPFLFICSFTHHHLAT